MLLVYLGLALVGYLIGATPVGVLVAGSRQVDIRSKGSGKTGTTNVLRSVGRRAALVVLVGDFLKGALAVAIARVIAESIITPNATVSWLDDRVSVLTLAMLFAAVGAVAGHVWSIYLRLYTGNWGGGRGVATAMGAMMVVNPWVSLTSIAVGVITIFISRYVSLGSILGSATGALVIIIWVLLGASPLCLLFISIAAFVIIAHHDNIDRLLKGTERKIGEQAKV